MKPFEKSLDFPLRIGRRAVQARLAYTTDDPFAATLVISFKGVQVPWRMARELLRIGRTRTVGVGDVQIRPGHNKHYTLIRLQSPGGDMTFEASTALITVFVMRIYEAVPEGREHEWLQLDREIAQLLTEEDEPA